MKDNKWNLKKTGFANIIDFIAKGFERLLLEVALNAQMVYCHVEYVQYVQQQVAIIFQPNLHLMRLFH